MSLIDYHRNTSDELLALTNKVRNLIEHWGEDGRYKEAVIKNIIRRFIPEKYFVGTGFVVKQTNIRGEHLTSKQIDLIIYDNESPILFKEGDFIILTPDAVRGIIEVKANLQNQNLTQVLKQANENGQFIFSGKINKKEKFFNGIFSFEGYENNFNLNTFVENYNNSNIDFLNDLQFKNYKVNHVSLNKDLFIKLWNNDENPHSLYRIENLSFSFFISNLTDTLANKSINKNNFIWFATDKELNLQKQF